VSNYFNETYYGDYYYHYYYYDYYYDDYYYGGNGKYAYPVAWYYNGYGYPSSVYFGVSSTYSYAEYGSYAGSSTEIQPALSGISAVANLKNYAADAKLTFDKAVATYNYVVAYTDLYMQADAKGWELGGQSLGDSIASSTTFNGDLWSGCATINDSLFSSARGNDTLSQLLSASSLGLQNDVALQKSLASNFGQYQINWRQQANTGAADVAWATNVKSARDSYFTALGDAQTSFDNTLSGALSGYANSMLEAQITRSESHYTSSQTRYNALESAMNGYSQSAFDTSKDAATKYLDAAIKEITDNAKEEKDAKEKEKDHYEEKAKEHEQDLDDKFEDLAEADADKNGVMGSETLEYGISGTAKDEFLTDYYGASAARSTAQNNLLAVADAAKTENTATVNTKASRDNALKNAINDAKKDNENTRKETDKETDKEYKNAANENWNTYLTATISTDTAHLKTFSQTEKTFKITKKEADDTYLSTVVPATVEYENELCRLMGRYYDAVGQANLGYGVDATFYANGATSTDVQVCFAAGFEIELADGTTKNIEDFDGTEEIWSRPHDNPTGQLQKCKVVRAFKNGIKETMLVKFDNCLELRGTKEHPFYVKEKGWVALGELKIGDVCFDREQNPIVVREIIRDGKIVEVYNIEVEGAHTYYIGKNGLEVLVHNSCTYGQAESAIRDAERIYAELLAMQRNGASDNAISAKYSDYLAARLRATKMYNEYVSSIWFKGSATKLNDMEKKLPVRLAEFETKSKPVEIAQYMQAQHEETKNSIADLQNYDNNMGKVEFGVAATSTACLVVGGGGLVVVGAGAVAATGVVGAVVVYGGGTALLSYGAYSAGSERINNGQSALQVAGGTTLDIIGVSGIYGGWTNTDIITGQNLGYTEAQAGMAFGGGIGQITLLANGPRLFNTGKNMMAPKTPAGIIDYGNGVIDVFSPSGPTTQITAGASYNPSMVTTNLAIANSALWPHWGTGALRSPARAILTNEGVLIDASHGLQSRTSGMFSDVILGKHGDAATKYLYTVDQRGVNIILEQTPFPTPRGNVVHTNISSTASIGGEVWFGPNNTVIINAGSGRFGDAAGITKLQWEATIKLWESLGYKVYVVPFGER